MAAVGDGSRVRRRRSPTSPRTHPLGLAHCVLIARDFLGDDDFVMYLGDNMLQQGLAEFVERFEAERGAGADARRRRAAPAPDPARPRADPHRFGVAEVDADGEVVRLVEKPDDPPSDLALVGVYLFDADDPRRGRAPSSRRARGELEITDAIQWLIDHGHRVRHEVLEGWWIDTGKKDPLLECNRLVLETLEPRIDGKVDDASRVDGRVVIEAGAELVELAACAGPAIIGARHPPREQLHRAVHRRSPPDCEIVDSELEHSVVLERSRIVGVARLTDSLIGRDVEVDPLGPAAPRPPA